MHLQLASIFSAVPWKGVSVKNFPILPLSLFVHIPFPNQSAVRSADQTHFAAKAFLEPRELWGHGTWTETSQPFLFLHGSLQPELNRKPCCGCVKFSFLLCACTSLLQTHSQWQFMVVIGKKTTRRQANKWINNRKKPPTPYKPNQSWGFFFLVFPLHFCASKFQQCDVSKHDCCTLKRNTQLPAASDLNKHFKRKDRAEVSLL